MHPRFAGASRMTLSSGGRTLDVAVADGPWLRLRGLTGIDGPDLEPLLFPRCRSLHTFWMKAPIDVVWLDLALDGDEGLACVLGRTESLPPRRAATASRGLDRSVRKRVAALELPPGLAAFAEVGQQLTVTRESRGNRLTSSALACQSAQAR